MINQLKTSKYFKTNVDHRRRKYSVINRDHLQDNEDNSNSFKGRGRVLTKNEISVAARSQDNDCLSKIERINKDMQQNLQSIDSLLQSVNNDIDANQDHNSSMVEIVGKEIIQISKGRQRTQRFDPQIANKKSSIIECGLLGDCMPNKKRQNSISIFISTDRGQIYQQPSKPHNHQQDFRVSSSLENSNAVKTLRVKLDTCPSPEINKSRSPKSKTKSQHSQRKQKKIVENDFQNYHRDNFTSRNKEFESNKSKLFKTNKPNKVKTSMGFTDTRHYLSNKYEYQSQKSKVGSKAGSKAGSKIGSKRSSEKNVVIQSVSSRNIKIYDQVLKSNQKQKSSHGWSRNYLHQANTDVANRKNLKKQYNSQSPDFKLNQELINDIQKQRIELQTQTLLTPSKVLAQTSNRIINCTSALKNHFQSQQSSEKQLVNKKMPVQSCNQNKNQQQTKVKNAVIDLTFKKPAETQKKKVAQKIVTNKDQALKNVGVKGKVKKVCQQGATRCGSGMTTQVSRKDEFLSHSGPNSGIISTGRMTPFQNTEKNKNITSTRSSKLISPKNRNSSVNSKKFFQKPLKNEKNKDTIKVVTYSLNKTHQTQNPKVSNLISTSSSQALSPKEFKITSNDHSTITTLTHQAPNSKLTNYFNRKNTNPNVTATVANPNQQEQRQMVGVSKGKEEGGKVREQEQGQVQKEEEGATSKIVVQQETGTPSEESRRQKGSRQSHGTQSENVDYNDYDYINMDEIETNQDICNHDSRRGSCLIEDVQQMYKNSCLETQKLENMSKLNRSLNRSRQSIQELNELGKALKKAFEYNEKHIGTVNEPVKNTTKSLYISHSRKSLVQLNQDSLQNKSGDKYYNKSLQKESPVSKTNLTHLKSPYKSPQKASLNSNQKKARVCLFQNSSQKLHINSPTKKQTKQMRLEEQNIYQSPSFFNFEKLSQDRDSNEVNKGEQRGLPFSPSHPFMNTRMSNLGFARVKKNSFSVSQVSHVSKGDVTDVSEILTTSKHQPKTNTTNLSSKTLQSDHKKLLQEFQNIKEQLIEKDSLISIKDEEISSLRKELKDIKDVLNQVVSGKECLLREPLEAKARRRCTHQMSGQGLKQLTRMLTNKYEASEMTEKNFVLQSSHSNSNHIEEINEVNSDNSDLSVSDSQQNQKEEFVASYPRDGSGYRAARSCTGTDTQRFEEEGEGDSDPRKIDPNLLHKMEMLKAKLSNYVIKTQLKSKQ